jgi:hypothetical protein
MNESTEGQRRPDIPAGIKRKVLVEAGHRCAIPTCRYIEVEIHHIVPWNQVQRHEYENLIALCANCHNRADRGEIDRRSLYIYKANLRFAHDKFSQFEMDFIFKLSGGEENARLGIPPYAQLLIKRLIDIEYVKEDTTTTVVKIAGRRVTPHAMYLTEKGKGFVRSLSLTEIE